MIMNTRSYLQICQTNPTDTISGNYQWPKKTRNECHTSHETKLQTSSLDWLWKRIKFGDDNTLLDSCFHLNKGTCENQWCDGKHTALHETHNDLCNFVLPIVAENFELIQISVYCRTKGETQDVRCVKIRYLNRSLISVEFFCNLYVVNMIIFHFYISGKYFGISILWSF